MESIHEETFKNANSETFLKDVNSERVEDMKVSTGLGKDEIFRPEFPEKETPFPGEETEIETETENPESKQNGEKVKDAIKSGEGEARMLITVLDMFFCRIDDAIAKTNNVNRWKISKQDKEDLIEIGAILSQEGKRLVNTTLLFWISMIVVFSGNVYSAYRYRKTGGEGFLPENDTKEDTGNVKAAPIIIMEEKKRTRYEVDEMGRYQYHGSKYLAAKYRNEIAEFKDYDRLVDANGAELINKLFRDQLNNE